MCQKKTGKISKYSNAASVHLGNGCSSADRAPVYLLQSLPTILHFKVEFP